jgi:ubiquinone/menaquinone biosynthesis C-methylase UbiE
VYFSKERPSLFTRPECKLIAISRAESSMSMETQEESQAATAKRLYDARSKVYDDSWHPAFAQYIVDSANLQPGERVLDLACGTGLVSFPAAEKVGPTGKIVGLDVSDGMLNEAKAKLLALSAPKNITCFNHDIVVLDTLPGLNKEDFDVITCASAFVLLSDPLAALQTWIKYLKPGGRLVVDASHPRNQLAGIVWEKVHLRLGIKAPYYRTWVKSENSLKIILHQAGFDVPNSKFEFKEQVGYSKRYLDVEDADDLALEGLKSNANRSLNTPELEGKARELFREEWKALSNTAGNLLEVDGVYVAVARKPTTPLPADASYISGSCACNSITWFSAALPKTLNNCYCEQCRKVSGSPNASFIHFDPSDVAFRPPLTEAPAKVVSLSPQAERAFCSECGSSVAFWYPAMAHLLAVAAGSVDEDASSPGAVAGVKQKHIFVRSKPSWYTLPDDGLERVETMPGVETFNTR